MPTLLMFFFESKENAPLTTGMLSRLIHPPFGFSGRNMTGGWCEPMSADGETSRLLYFDAEQDSQPQ